MATFLTIIFCIVLYIVAAGATHGYAHHRWPPKMVDYWGRERDQNDETRAFAAILWPFYWVFVWPFTKTNELAFSHIEKTAALHIAKNKTRIADLGATREQVAISNAELEQAEAELEKEIGKL